MYHGRDTFACMESVTVRELRNHGGRVLERVTAGETLLVTKDGVPVAELAPLRKEFVAADELLARWRRLPALDADRLRDDLDAVLAPDL